MDILTTIGTIIGIIAGIFGIFYWIFTRKKDKKEKDDEKKIESLNRPDCKITLLYRINLSKEEYSFVVGIPKNQDKANHYILPLPISIANQGKMDLEEIKVIFSYVAKSPLPISDEAISIQAVTGIVNATRQYKKTEEGQYTTYLLDKIPQKVAAEINEPIRLFSSHNEVKFPAESKDGVKFIANIKYEMLFFFEFYVLAKNTEVKKIKLKIYVYPSNDLDDLLNQVTDKIKNDKSKKKEEPFPNDFMVFYPEYDLKSSYKKDKLFFASVSYANFRRVFVNKGIIHIAEYDDSENPIDKIPL